MSKSKNIAQIPTSPGLTSNSIEQNVADCTIDQLLDNRIKIDEAIREQLLDELFDLSNKYLRAFGKEKGLKQLGEDLCTEVAPRVGDTQWTNLVLHLKRISG